MWLLAACLFAGGPAAAAQDGHGPSHADEIEGVVLSSESGEPLAGATVWVVGTGSRVVTHGDGSFHLTAIDEGRTHALRVERLGYRGVTVEVTLGAAMGANAADRALPVEIALEPSPIALEAMVVTAAVAEQDAAQALRPISVLAGDDLQRQMEGTVAATLASLPGVSAASMGPSATQPVIRGMSGDRVLVLEDGVQVNDVAHSAPDHATALNAALARRIEVVRGPRGLLYGGNALGGVINVIRDEIPSAVPQRYTGAATAQTQTVSDAFAGSASATFALAEKVPVTLEGSARTFGDLGTPMGTLFNTQGSVASGGAGLSYVTDWGHAGAAVQGYRNHYGIPGGFVGGHAEGVRIEMDRFSTKFRTVVEPEDRAFRTVRFDASYGFYEHLEIESSDIVGTIFRRESARGDVLARHGSLGPFRGGALGARVAGEDFGYGGSLYTPNTRRTTAAAYIQEEAELGALLVEWGARYDWIGTDPGIDDPDTDIGHIRTRGFHGLSWSLGVLYNTSAGLTFGATTARAFRAPDIEELYSQGPHLAAYVFEVGNPSLQPEVGQGFDVFARVQSDRLRGQVTGFYNDIQHYIYGEDTGRLSRVLLPIYTYHGNDAVFRGFEADLAADLGGGMALEAVVSSVRGHLDNEDEDPLPLVPPLGGHVALKYERPQWFVRGETEMAARQERVGEFEDPTDGYAVLNLAAGARITMAGRLNVLTISLDNATDTAYRNHLSRVKEIMPEAGRGVSVTYRVVF